MTRGYKTESDEDVEELEEGDLLELPARDAVIIKHDVKYDANYKSMEELGKGKFGVVYKCRRNADNEILAAKFVRKTASSKEEVTREIEMMNLLHHKRLIQLYDAYETPKEMVVIMELVTGGELFEKVVEDDNLTEKQVIRYMKQILYGVQHMHRRQMVHLDLKPENILCLGGGKPGYEQIKLIDFGMTRILKDGENESALCGTPEFVAPEVITFNPITIQADMWSLGVITYVLLSGLSPFMGDDDNETLSNVTSGEFDFEDDDEIFENLSDQSKQFIEECLVLNPKKRMSIDQSLSHDWLTGVGRDHKINTSNLKKFIARRRWQRTMNTIKAVSRLAGGLSLFGKKSGAHGFGKGGFLEKVKQQQEKEEEELKKKEKEEENKKIAEERERKEKEESERIKREEGKKAEVEQKRKKEVEMKQKEEAEKKLKEEAEIKRKEDERKKKEETEKKLKEEADIKRRTGENEKKRKEEADKKQKAEENERKRKEEAARKRKEDIEEKEALRKKEEAEKVLKRKAEQEEKEKKQKADEEVKRKRKEVEDKLQKEREEKKRKETEEAKKSIERIHDEDIAEIKHKEIEKCNDPIEKKKLIDAERKRKRDEERIRRQEERKHNEEIRKLNKVNSTTSSTTITTTTQNNDENKTVIKINNFDENQNIINLKTDINQNNLIIRTDQIKQNSNLKSSSSPLITRKFGHPSPRNSPLNSPRNSPKGSPIIGKRDGTKAGGGVMNRIAAFQTGDIYWNNKKK